MNSVTLLQMACATWLSAADQSALSVTETELLIAAVNSAIARVWRGLPAHYRRQTFSCAFGEAVSGTVTATAGSRSASWGFPGSLLNNFQREFCSVAAGSIRNEYRLGSLLHPWPDSSGTFGAVIYHDATIRLGYLIERVLAPMTELRRREVWSPAPAMESHRLWACPARFYDIQRITFTDTGGERDTRTLFRVAHLDGSPRLFESVVSVVPAPLRFLDASVPYELPHDEEVADIVAVAAGIDLQTHPRWRGAPLDTAIGASARVAALADRPTSDPHSISTPRGW